MGGSVSSRSRQDETSRGKPNPFAHHFRKTPALHRLGGFCRELVNDVNSLHLVSHLALGSIFDPAAVEHRRGFRAVPLLRSLCPTHRVRREGQGVVMEVASLLTSWLSSPTETQRVRKNGIRRLLLLGSTDDTARLLDRIVRIAAMSF